MISHKHKCIFVHIPKAAGTSVETFFLNDLGLHFEDKLPLLLGASTNRYMAPRVISHLTAEQMVSQHYISQELYNEYHSFTVVRHPVDRLFSTYKYWGFDAIISFDIFIKKVFPALYKQADTSFFLLPQTDYLYSKNGTLLVDIVCHLEQLDSDFKAVAKKLNMEFDKLPHANKGTSKSSLLRGVKKISQFPGLLGSLHLGKKKSKKLSTEATEIVRDYYQADFDHFNYDSNAL